MLEGLNFGGCSGPVLQHGRWPIGFGLLAGSRRFHTPRLNREVADDFQNHESVLKLHKIYIVLI